MSSPAITPAERRNSWFILCITRSGHIPIDFLILSDPAEAIQTAASALETTVLGRFGCTRDVWIPTFYVFGLDSVAMVITTMQLYVYLRDLPTSPSPKKPNLWGYGSNEVGVIFQKKGERDR